MYIMVFHLIFSLSSENYPHMSVYICIRTTYLFGGCVCGGTPHTWLTELKHSNVETISISHTLFIMYGYRSALHCAKEGIFNGVLVSIIKKVLKIVFSWNTELHTCANQELDFTICCNKRTAQVTRRALHCSRASALQCTHEEAQALHVEYRFFS